MRLPVGASLLLSVALLFPACGRDPLPIPTAPSRLPEPVPAAPAPPEDEWSSAQYALTATLTSVTGKPCGVRETGWQEYVGVPETYVVQVQRSGKKVRVWHNGDSRWGTIYEGQLTGRDFTASAELGGITVRCSDGNEYQAWIEDATLEGQLSADARTLTATLRWSWRQLPPGDGILLTLTWTWSATRK